MGIVESMKAGVPGGVLGVGDSVGAYDGSGWTGSEGGSVGPGSCRETICGGYPKSTLMNR